MFSILFFHLRWHCVVDCWLCWHVFSMLRTVIKKALLKQYSLDLLPLFLVSNFIIIFTISIVFSLALSTFRKSQRQRDNFLKIYFLEFFFQNILLATCLNKMLSWKKRTDILYFCCDGCFWLSIWATFLYFDANFNFMQLVISFLILTMINWSYQRWIVSRIDRWFLKSYIRLNLIFFFILLTF